MPGVQFDLATKIIPSDQVIWIVFPGRSRRFLDAFTAGGMIFLETPGVKLTPAVLQDDDRLRKHVAMSEAIAAYIRGVDGTPPSRNANTYPVRRNASFNSAVGNVRSMFGAMKPGDLVVMGARSLYAPVIAGEIVSQFDPSNILEGGFYDGEGIPFRKVKWLPVRTQRRQLSERLSQLLSNRHAVISLSKEEFGDEIYTLAYGDYIFGGESRYVFPGPKYKNVATATVPGITLISYFVAAFHAYEIGELPQFSSLSIGDAINNYFEQDILYSFELEFASPGNYILHSRRAALALTAAVLVAATVGDISLDQAKAAEVTNSAHAGPMEPHEVEIHEKYRAIMESMGAERYNQLVAKNKEAQDGVGLKVKVKIKK